MEIRANYILVGAFTLLVLIGAVGFTLWASTRSKDVALTYYDISFEDGVKGLSMSSEVLFSGIRVGKITEIKISQVKPGAVRVRISVSADTPVREDSRASIESRGITGSSVISISGGTEKSPLMVVPEDSVGIIVYEPSALDSVVAQVPDVLSSANSLLQRLEKVVSDENIKAVNDILASSAAVTNTFASKAGTIDAILSDTERTLRKLEELVSSANEVMSGDLKNAGNAMSSAAKRLDSTLRGMEPGLKQFSAQGLSDVRMLMVEARNLVHVLTRVGQKLESDPRRFFFGDQVQEYKN